MNAMTKLRGIIFLILLFLSSFLGIMFFAGWCLPIVFISPRLFRKAMDMPVGYWLTYAPALMEIFLGIKMVITGDEIRHGERSLIIMNHRTRLDWMYFWSVLVRQSGVKTEKIILKHPLKNIPGPGWAMQSAAFIFIKRNWEVDKKILIKMLNYFAAIKHKTQILLFPEGTDLTPKTKERSDKFASEHNLQPYDYVLHPRTTGFNFIAQTMRNNDHLDAVYDVSIAYPHNFPSKEIELLKGNIPKEVHFHIKRHSVTELPESDEGLSTWCNKVWEDKEELLKEYYTEDKAFPGEQIQDKCSGNRNAYMTLCIAFTYWTTFVIGILLVLYYSSLARWLAVGQILFYSYMSYRGGFDIFQADFYNKLKGMSKKST